jgi:hypothetical protein
MSDDEYHFRMDQNQPDGRGQSSQIEISKGQTISSSHESDHEDPQMVVQQLRRAEEMADQVDTKVDMLLDNLEMLLSSLEREDGDGKSATKISSNESTSTGR